MQNSSWFKRVRRIVIPATIMLTLIVFSLKRKHSHTLTLTTCLKDAHGIQTKTPVAIAGVDLGVVNSIRAQPQDASCPAYVEMKFISEDEIKIPKDSVVTKEPASVIADAYLEIDTVSSVGQRAKNGERLISHEPPNWNMDETARAVQQLPGVVEAIQSFEAIQKQLDSQPAKQLPAKGNRATGKTGK